MESAVSRKLSLIVIRSKVELFVSVSHVRHLEIFELVRLEDERELATRLEAVSYKNDAQEGWTIMISDVM